MNYQVKTDVNQDGVYIYFNGEEIVSWLWEEVNEDDNVFGAISNALYLAHNDPQELLKKLKKEIYEYYDVHVCGKNGFSAPVKIPVEKIEEGYEDLSIIQFAYESGLIDVEDRDFVDEVREINYDEYLQMKGITSEKFVDSNWEKIQSTIEDDISNGDWTAIYELLSFLPEDKLNGFLREI
jgi:hypothetical protein